MLQIKQSNQKFKRSSRARTHTHTRDKQALRVKHTELRQMTIETFPKNINEK